MVTNENTYRSEVHFYGIGGYDVMNTTVPYVWEPRYCHQNFVGQLNGFITAHVSRYLWVPRYRLRSEILITGKVGYHRAKPGCQVSDLHSTLDPHGYRGILEQGAQRSMFNIKQFLVLSIIKNVLCIFKVF